VRVAADKFLVFVLTWFSYATIYLTRKNFSVVKSDLHNHAGISVADLAIIDTCFLVFYAVGQFVSGFLGDRFGARKIIACGLMGSALVSFCFGFTQSALVFTLLFAVNGIFQSTGWANNIKALEPWFDHADRGKIMAWWGTNQQIGGLLATVLAAFLLARFGWQSAFFVPSVVVFLVGFVVVVFLPEPQTLQKKEAVVTKKLINYWSLISNPFLISLSLSYFGIKLIRYCLLFWLPFYFHNELGLATDVAGYASVSFEVGGIAGSFLIGWISDRYFSHMRVRLIAPLIMMLAAVFYAYQQYAGLGLMVNCLFMLAVGFLVFGPDALISGACAQDIGGENTGSIAGFINGVGSLGAILQGALTTYVSTMWGWSALFYVFFVISLFSALLLVPFMSVSFATNKEPNL
jgi:sugar phosphate permease